MDRWNRKDQNEYTGITAQRRNRRRTGTEPVRPEKAQGTVPRAETPDLSVWMRPVTPRKPEEPREPETAMDPEIPAEPEMPAEPEIPMEPEVTA